MFLYYNILAGSLLFLWLISHYPWFPLELHDPFKNNGNNLTCACKPKVSKPKQWDSVVNEVLMLVNTRAKISSAMHTMAENWPFRMTIPEPEETAGDCSLTLYTGMTRFPRSGQLLGISKFLHTIHPTKRFTHYLVPNFKGLSSDSSQGLQPALSETYS